MHFEGRRRGRGTPNLTPLIDVVFLLLVFFMLTSHFVREEAINVDLPTAESGEAVEADARLELILDARGRVLMHDRIVTLESLEPALRTELAARKDKVVRIRGDRAASLGGAVAVLDAARKAGASGIDLVTEHK
ncbi:MAG: biopolymer transporter ExbD [Gammaproteobacteria bacterium]